MRQPTKSHTAVAHVVFTLGRSCLACHRPPPPPCRASLIPTGTPMGMPPLDAGDLRLKRPFLRRASLTVSSSVISSEPIPSKGPLPSAVLCCTRGPSGSSHSSLPAHMPGASDASTCRHPQPLREHGGLASETDLKVGVYRLSCLWGPPPVPPRLSFVAAMITPSNTSSSPTSGDAPFGLYLYPSLVAVPPGPGPWTYAVVTLRVLTASSGRHATLLQDTPSRNGVFSKHVTLAPPAACQGCRRFPISCRSHARWCSIYRLIDDLVGTRSKRCPPMRCIASQDCVTSPSRLP